ncbi:MAG: stage sporulation protein [Eubacteriales bacterium]|nr:stage sporulation protein [Eubacteriales bacterium]
MLDALKEMVRNIAVIVVLGSVLEFILPEGKMNRYTRLVTGLFLLMAILNPILSLLNRETFVPFLRNDQPALARAQGSGVEAILARGEKLRQEAAENARSEWEKGVKKQVTSLVELQQGVKVTGVEVELASTPAAEAPGKIKKIVVRIAGKKEKEGEGGEEGIFIKPVEVEIKSGREDESASPPLPPGVKSKIKSLLAGFYGLSESQIVVEEGKEGT